MTDVRSGQGEIHHRRVLAERIAKVAGARAKGFLSKPERLKAELKSSTQDLVSIADRVTESYLRRMIKKNFPDDGIVGEEAGSTIGSSGYTWVIDPIDGTMAFSWGNRTGRCQSRSLGVVNL